MRPRTTIILVSLLVLAALAVGISRLVEMRSKEKGVAVPRRLFAESPSGAKKLTIVDYDGAKLIFVRSDGRWRMIEPRDIPVRDEFLDAIVRAMSDTDYQRAFDPNVDTDYPDDLQTGLEKPLWTVSLVDEKDKTFALLVGRPVPEVGSGVEETYVRPGGGNRSFVVARDMAELLERSGDEYRDMTVLRDFNRRDVIALRIEGRQNYTLKKKRDRWEIVKPFAAQADGVTVSRLLGELTSLKAERYLSEKTDNLEPFGLERPQLLVHVTTRLPEPATTTAPALPDQTYTLLLGNRRGESLCAKLEYRPEVFTLPAAVLDNLQPALAKVRGKTILAFRPSQVESIEVRRGAEQIILKRNGGWEMVNPFTGPAEEKPVIELLEKLAELKVNQWITPQTTGEIDITSPKATITLDLPQEERKISLLIGGKDPSGKMIYCKQAGGSSVAAVEEDKIKAILQPASHYRPQAEKNSKDNAEQTSE